MALPRLTGALRSFSNVTRHDDYSEELADLTVNIFLFFPNYKLLVYVLRILWYLE